jgi:hypothetical protein
MHTILLEGGLGNQLFMIFAVLGHALKYNIPFYFEDTDIQQGSRRKTYWDSFFEPLSKFIKKGNAQGSYVYREPNFHYTDIPPFPGDVHVKFIGYFQSYKYFHENKNTIFKLMNLEKFKKQVRDKMEGLVDWKTTVSMHFRMGDYKALPQFHPILPLEYYKNALTSVQYNNDVHWTVLYFCEDEDFESVSEKIKELSRNFPRMTFERRSVLKEDWEEIIAMSLCRHNIIANSSFSYFGAYFNTQADVQVYYPSVWLGPAFATKDTTHMCPPHWIKVITQ